MPKITTDAIQEETEKRAAKAREALATGAWEIKDDPLYGGYTVKTSRNLYFVDLDQGKCTCQDFKRNGVLYPCKHLVGVRMWRERRTQKPNHKDKESPMDPMNPSPNVGWAKFYHPTTGVLVTLPVEATSPKAAMQSVERYLAAGWKAEYAEVEKETRVEVRHIVRRVKTNADGTETPVLDVYNGGKFRILGVYLNTPQDVAAFEHAFGKKLTELPLYEGGSPIERGANPRLDSKYVVAVSGVSVVYKPNPRWEGEEDKKHQKRLFVRWERNVPAAPQAVSPSTPPPAPSKPAPQPKPVATPTRAAPPPAPSVNGNGNGQPKAAVAAPAAPPAQVTQETDPVAWARSVICPMGSRSRPDLAGKPLGEVLAVPEIGPKVIAFLATQFTPGTDVEREAVKAAKILHATMQ